MFFTSDAESSGRRGRKAGQPDAITGQPGRPGTGLPRRSHTALGRAGFSIGAGAVDAVVILASALAAGLVYQRDARIWDTVTSSMIVAILFIGTNMLRGDYAMPLYLSAKSNLERALMAWIIAFGATLTLGFLTKTSAIYSRGATAILFVFGFAALMDAAAF